MGKKALGRSMAAIFGDHKVLDQTEDKVREESVQEIEISLVVPNPYQPRQVFDIEEIQGLANSIQEQGLLTPILVRKRENEYQIVAGERRFRACQLLGLKTIRAGVFDRLSDKKMMEWALIENIQRVQLSAIEEGVAYDQLISHHNYTHDELAKTLGKSRSTVTNTLRLLRLPESVQEFVRTGLLSAGHARSLLSPEIKDPESLAKQMIETGMNVREAEKKAKGSTSSNQKKEKWVDPNQKALEDEFRFALGSQVKINFSGRGGFVQINFTDTQDLQRILDLVRKGQDSTYG